MTRRALVWFREDLRVADNMALFAACQNNQQVVALYVIDPQAWRQHDMAACRVNFLLRNLKAMQQSLASLNIPLLIFEIADSQQVFDLMSDITSQLEIDTLYFNDQYEIDEYRRDQQIIATLGKKLSIMHFTDQVIFGPGEILTKQGKPYTVFTPYKKAFITKWLERGGVHVLNKPKPLQVVELKTINVGNGIHLYSEIPTDIHGFQSNVPEEYWPAGELAAQQRLNIFVSEKIMDYKRKRDFPAIQGTSIISPYLSNGVLSPRQCFAAALAVNQGRLIGGYEGIDCWISELIWREFYKQILWAFPRVSMHQPFNEKTQQIQWNNDESVFQAWCQGRTGYPIVDAAMRQLHQMGWMHNRLRMIVAMFLTKDCFIDWRWGEKYFMQHLIDGDLAANNGGWQWSASTGTDAAPYFRIFNPVLQSQKFDPEGIFIKRYCPELKEVPISLLHDPAKLPNDLNYPKPIIDRRDSKERVLSAFKKIQKGE